MCTLIFYVRVYAPNTIRRKGNTSKHRNDTPLLTPTNDMKMENVYPKNSKRKNNKKKCLYITPKGLKEKTVITHNMKSESLFFSFFFYFRFSFTCIHFLPFILGNLLHFPSFLFHLFSFIIIRKRK